MLMLISWFVQKGYTCIKVCQLYATCESGNASSISDLNIVFIYFFTLCIHGSDKHIFICVLAFANGRVRFVGFLTLCLHNRVGFYLVAQFSYIYVQKPAARGCFFSFFFFLFTVHCIEMGSQLIFLL